MGVVGVYTPLSQNSILVIHDINTHDSLIAFQLLESWSPFPQTCFGP